MVEPSVERRIVSVLFADLVGFTTLSERLDAEDIAAVQEAYFAAVRETLTRHGGVVEKFIGDAVMAVFGLPRTRDDDAERAVRAGLALVATVEALGGRIGLDESDLRLRVGVTTGEVAHTAGSEGDRVSGDVVNTAARLQAAADPGSVLVDETTTLAVAEMIETDSRDPLSLKGKAEPTHVAIARAVRPDRSRDAAMGALRAPTVGREGELAILGEALGRVLAGASERWLAVAPPGVGKSRLLAAFAERVTGGAVGRVVVRHTRLRPDAAGPFDAVAALMRQAVEAAAEPLEVRIRQGGQSAARRLVLQGRAAELMGAIPDGADAPAEPGAADRDRLFADWLEILASLSMGSTEVWLVEDVHWSTPDLRAFLDGALGSGTPRLIVATSRPSLLDDDPGWTRSDPSSGRHRLDLDTLDPTDAGTLVRALVGEAIPAPVVERIVERSDGSPLFIEETLRTWVSIGILQRADAGARGGGWRLTVDDREVPIPATVQAVYAAQLDDLSADARTLARRASVAGRRFARASLLALDLADPDPALETLRRREIVGDPALDALIGETLAYRHALLRDASYASLARAERARYHVRLARWLEAAAGPHAADVAEAIAGHYEAALASAPALAVDLGDGLDRSSCTALAADWLERAGVHGMATGALEHARGLLTRAVALTTAAESLALARRRRLLAIVSRTTGAMDDARMLLESALADAHRALDEARTGEDQAAITAARRESGTAGAALAATLLEQLRFDDARRVAHEELEWLGRGRDESTARLLSIHGQTGVFLTNSPEDLPEIEEAAAIAEGLGDPVLRLEVLERLVRARADLDGAGSVDWTPVARLADAVGDWPRSVTARLEPARILLWENDPVGLAMLDEVEALAEAHGLAEQLAWIDQARCSALFLNGDWDGASAAGRRAITRAAVGGLERAAVRTWFPLCFLAHERQDAQLLADAATWMIAHSDYPDSPYARLMHTGVRIRLAAAGLLPMPDVGRSHLWPGLEFGPTGLQQLEAARAIVDEWSAAGRFDDVADALDLLAALHAAEPEGTTESGPAESVAAVVLMRADLLARTGRPAEAIVAARSALEGFRAAAVPFGTLRSLRVLARLGATSAAEDREAAAVAGRLGIPSPP